MASPEKTIMEELEKVAVGRGLEFKLNFPHTDQKSAQEEGLWTIGHWALLTGVNGRIDVIYTSKNNPAGNAVSKPSEYLITVVYNPSSLGQSFVDVKIRPDRAFDTNNPDIFLKGSYKQAFSALLDMMEGK